MTDSQGKTNHTTDLLHLQEHLATSIIDAPQQSQAVTHALSVLRKLTNAIAVQYLSADSQGLLTSIDESLNHSIGLDQKTRDRILHCGNLSASHNKAQIDRGNAPSDLTVICVPVSAAKHTQVLASVMHLGGSPIESFLIAAQLVASHLSFRHRSQSLEIISPTFLSNLIQQTLANPDPKQACFILVNDLVQALNASFAAVALGKPDKLQLIALAGPTEFDPRSKVALSSMAALTECASSNAAVSLHPDSAGRTRHPAHLSLADTVSQSHVVSIPLSNGTGRTIGAWLFMWKDEMPPHADIASLHAFSNIVGPLVYSLQQAKQGPFARGLQILSRGLRSRRTLTHTIAAIALFLVSFLPIIPHYVSATCVVRPVIRRVICAPFDGILQQSFVTIGNTVTQGQVLASMDDSDARIEHAALIADKYRASKMIEANQASGNISAAKLAEYDKERIEHGIAFLNKRIANMEIKAPVTGVVLQGDMSRVEGAPLRKGQTLFEMAPLDAMLAEIHIREGDIADIHPGALVRLRFISYPQLRSEGSLKRILPQSSVIEHDNVFIGETPLLNKSATLRPGMKGRARIACQKRSLLWILFRRPLSALRTSPAGDHF